MTKEQEALRYETAKQWFQDVTEADVELMIRMGAITKKRVIEMYNKEVVIAELEV